MRLSKNGGDRPLRVEPGQLEDYDPLPSLNTHPSFFGDGQLLILLML